MASYKIKPKKYCKLCINLELDKIIDDCYCKYSSKQNCHPYVYNKKNDCKNWTPPILLKNTNYEIYIDNEYEKHNIW